MTETRFTQRQLVLTMDGDTFEDPVPKFNKKRNLRWLFNEAVSVETIQR